MTQSFLCATCSKCGRLYWHGPTEDMDRETLDLAKITAREVAAWHRTRVSCGGKVETFVRTEDRA